MKSFTMSLVLAIFCGATVTAPALAAERNGRDARDMQAMSHEPHHMLVMAYKESLTAFAKTLQRPAGQTAPLDPVMARTAVTEMRRSFNLMNQHCQEHMSTMSDEMKTRMSSMIQQMDTKTVTIGRRISDLEREVSYNSLDATVISGLAGSIIYECDHITRMHVSHGNNVQRRN